MNRNKELVKEYLRALSGQTKTPELVARYVSDPLLARHIADSEIAFPGYDLTSEEMICEGDLVVVRGQMRGVHRGEFAGIPATGKTVSVGIILIYRIAGEKIVEHWMHLQFDSAIAGNWRGGGDGMKFMLSWTAIPGTLKEAVDRFLAGVGQVPEGVTLLGRWHKVDCSGGFSLCHHQPKRII